jgi:alpha-glucosidase
MLDGHGSRGSRHPPGQQPWFTKDSAATFDVVHQLRERPMTPGRDGSVVYQIAIRSFMDASGDGVGDLDGIARRLDHVARLGADAIWITPFQPSPMADFGYDVADYTGVDPLFGDFAAFDRVIARAKSLGLKVLIDLVASHTSSAHAWFRESAASRDNPKSDWYVWVDPKPDGSPPNNWLAVFGGPAWEWHPKRRQYYLHNFLVSQPDLNFHQPMVQDAILDAARTWLDRGVDGFRLDVVNYYFHDRKLRPNPPAPLDRVLRVTSRANPYGWQDHVHDHTRPETLGFVARLRALIDTKPGAYLMGELVTDRFPEKQARAYTAGPNRLHMVYSFDLFADGLDAATIRATLRRVDGAIGPRGWVAWAWSNHDVKRVISRFGFEDAADAAGPTLIAVLGSIRGTPCLYQGEELGLPEADVPFEALRDPYGIRFWPEYKGRDGCRTPMPWDDTAGVGFTTGTPWLPVDPRHRARSVASQAGVDGSALERTRAFLHWRRDVPELLTGAMTLHDAPEPVLLIERRLGRRRVVAAINLGREPVTFDAPVFVGATPLPGHGFAGTIEGSMVTLPPFGAVFARG